MKLKATYTKTSGGKILAQISVKNKEDYPAYFIFESAGHYPTNNGFAFSRLEVKYSFDFISNRLDNSKSALAWVNRQVGALKVHLDAWRALQVPEDTEFTI